MPQPIQLTPKQLQAALAGNTIEVLVPITPSPEKLQETGTPHGAWRHAHLAMITDSNHLAHNLKKFASPVKPGDHVYATEPFTLTRHPTGGVVITFDHAPDIQLQPELPNRVPRSALTEGPREPYEMHPWASRLHLHVNSIQAEAVAALPPPRGKPNEWIPHPWVWRLHLQPINH